jgi:hypothetical protein
MMGFDVLNILSKPDSGAAQQPLGTGAGFTAEVPVENGIFAAAQAFREKVPPVLDWIVKNKDLVIGAILGIIGAIIIFKTISAVVGIVQGIGAVIGALASPITLVIALVAVAAYLVIKNWDEIKEGIVVIWDAIKEYWGGVWTALSRSGTFKENFSTGWNMFWGSIRGFFTGIGEGIKTAWVPSRGGFLTSGKISKATFLRDGTTSGETIRTFFVNVGNGIKAKWDSFTGGIEDGWERFKTTIEPLGNVLDEHQQVFQEHLERVAFDCRNGVNGIIKGLNKIIGGITSIQIDVPKWLEKITGYSSFGFNIGYLSEISIPRAATGDVAVPNTPYLAMLGDNTREKEVVSPLSTMKEAFKDAVVDMRQTGSSGLGGNMTFLFNIGSHTLRAVVTKEMYNTHCRREKRL